ncbi:MAG: hypothetical protein WBR24_07395 [Desulfobacterales bacterium]|jgi:hypothetical protein
MSFYTEPSGYQKTIVSDLQGAWQNLREAVVDNAGFEDWDRILFHVDEAMSWESVRDIDRMQSTLTVIRNIAAQTDIPDEPAHWIQEVSSILDKVLEKIRNGIRL